MGRKLIYLIMLVLLMETAAAATVHGTVYSFDLEKKTNAIVRVNSIPLQTIVSKDGEYSFELSPGVYTINASYYENNTPTEFVSENIKIEKEGSYILDLILFPSFEEEEELLKETEGPALDENILTGKVKTIDVIILVIALVSFAVIVYFILRYKKALAKVSEEIKETETADESRKILDFIKKHGGRTTQKEIRKTFPSSEAKISLIISELKDKGIIKKIKKGRGNIIILKRC